MEKAELLELVLGMKVKISRKYACGGMWLEVDSKKFRLLERMSIYLKDD